MDGRILSFQEEDINDGYIQAGIRTDDIKNILIHIQENNTLMKDLGFILIIIGIGIISIAIQLSIPLDSISRENKIPATPALVENKKRYEKKIFYQQKIYEKTREKLNIVDFFIPKSSIHEIKFILMCKTWYEKFSSRKALLKHEKSQHRP
ncbi:MAG: hypothetical protein ACTSYS_12980 [Promethearchaeota archaeon]